MNYLGLTSSEYITSDPPDDSWEFIGWAENASIEVLDQFITKNHEEEIRYRIENIKDLYPTVITMESRDLGEWYDDHPLNKKETYLAEFERLFNEQA